MLPACAGPSVNPDSWLLLHDCGPTDMLPPGVLACAKGLLLPPMPVAGWCGLPPPVELLVPYTWRPSARTDVYKQRVSKSVKAPKKS
jgi:hypothetical protein